MALTIDQQQKIELLKRKYPSQIPQIMKAVEDYERANEGTLSRSADLFGNSFLREAPLGFGDELGWSDPNQPEARDWIESGASMAGSVAGQLPSLGAMLLTGGVAGLPALGGKVGARLLGKQVAEKVGQSTLARMATEGGIGALHAGLSKQEGETGIFDQNLGESLKAGAMGGVTGLAVGGTSALLSSADSKLADSIYTTFKQKYGEQQARNAMRATQVGGATLAGAVSSAPFIAAEGGSAEDILAQSLAMGMLTAFDGLPKKFLSETNLTELNVLKQNIQAEGRLPTPEEADAINTLVSEIPTLKESASDILDEIRARHTENIKSRDVTTQDPMAIANDEGMGLSIDDAIEQVKVKYNLITDPEAYRAQRQADLEATLSPQALSDNARLKREQELQEAFGQQKQPNYILDDTPDVEGQRRQRQRDVQSAFLNDPKLQRQADLEQTLGPAAERENFTSNLLSKLQTSLRHTVTGGNFSNIVDQGKLQRGPNAVSDAIAYTREQLKKVTDNDEKADWEWVLNTLETQGRNAKTPDAIQELYDTGQVTSVAETQARTATDVQSGDIVESDYQQQLSQLTQQRDELLSDIEGLKAENAPDDVIAELQQQADDITDEIAEAKEYIQRSISQAQRGYNPKDGFTGDEPTKSVGAAMEGNTDTPAVTPAHQRALEILKEKKIDKNDVNEFIQRFPAFRNKDWDSLTEDEMNVFLMLWDESPTLYANEKFGKYRHMLNKLVRSQLGYLDYMGRKYLQKADETGFISESDFNTMSDMLNGNATIPPERLTNILENGWAIKDGETYRLTNSGKSALGSRLLIKYGNTPTGDVRPGTILELAEGDASNPNYMPVNFNQMVIRKNPKGGYDKVWSADPDISYLDLETGNVIMNGRQMGDQMQIGGRQYQMQEGDMLVDKPSAMQLSDRIKLRQKTADVMAGTSIRKFRNWMDRLHSEVENRGLDVGEEMADRSTDDYLRQTDVFKIGKRKHDEKGGTKRFTFWDVMEQRYIQQPDGEKIFVNNMDDVRSIADPNIQSVTQQKSGDIKIPAWWIPYIEELNGLNGAFANASEAAGLRIRVGDTEMPWAPRDLYAPFIHNPETYDKLTPDTIINNLKAKNPSISDQEAREYAKFMIEQRKKKARTYGNLEMSREFTPKEGYIVNPLIRFGQYYMRASERVTDAQLFGNFNQSGRAMVAETQLQGGDDFVEKVYDSVLGLEDRALEGSTRADWEHLAEKLRYWTMVTKMSMSFLPQMSQVVNTATMTSYKDVFRSFQKSVREANKDVVDDSFAVLVETFRGNIAQEMGMRGGEFPKWAVWLKAFTTSDAIVRNLSANTAVVYARRQLDILKSDPSNINAQMALKELRIDPAKALDAYIDGDETTLNRFFATGANTLSKETQFLARPENLPHYSRTPLGSLIFQFKSFAFMQANFLYKMMLKGDTPATQRAKRAIKYLAGATVAGEAISDIKSLVLGAKREDMEDELPSRLLWNVSTAGGFGIAFDFLKTMSEGRYATSELLVGPAMSSIVRLAADSSAGVWNTLSSAMDENGEFDISRMRTAGQTAVKTLPFGQQLSRHIFQPDNNRWEHINPLSKGGAEHILTGRDQSPMGRLEYQQEKMRKRMRAVKKRMGLID